jgi:hypothetical protein
MSIRVNMQLTGNEPIEVNRENFPRLFTGDQQTAEISIEYAENGLDIQSTIANDSIFVKSVNRWIETEEIKLNRQLAEIQKKLGILKSVK